MDIRTRAHRHVSACLRGGASTDVIAAECGVSTPTVVRAAGNPDGLTPVSCERLLTAAPSMSRKVPSWRAARRIHSLRSAGWTVDEIAGMSGVSSSSITLISRESTPTVQLHTFEAIRELYDRLECVPVRDVSEFRDGAGVRARWVTPWGWDDIDDPTESRGDDPQQFLPAVFMGRLLHIQHREIEGARVLLEGDIADDLSFLRSTRQSDLDFRLPCRRTTSLATAKKVIMTAEAMGHVHLGALDG